MPPSSNGDLPTSGVRVLDNPEHTAPAGQGRRLGRRGVWVASLAALLVLALVAVIAVLALRGGDDSGDGGGTSSSDPLPPDGESWSSGAAGYGVGDGEFEQWRGTRVDVASTWQDNNGAMTALEVLQPGNEYGDWDRDLDISIGAIGEDESWAEAAQGAYDDRWSESLTNLRDAWAGRPGQLYIRFAHESNGSWYDWSVNQGNYEDFIASWRDFRALQQEIVPEAELVFAVNKNSVGNGMDWRDTFPGAEYVDVMAVDYYNQDPAVTTESEWAEQVDAVDRYGAPVGLDQHLAFAESVGLPLAVPEWGLNAEQSDSAVFVQKMHEWFAAHAGTGAGQVLYECLFNVEWDGDRWRLFGSDRMPDASQAYRDLF